MAKEIDIDIAVVGAGPAGIAAALALAHGGASVALIGPPPAASTPRALDTRTAALLESSIDMLKALGVWDALLPHAAPLKAIRIIDASGSLLRAPDVEFSASELGLEAFGYNIANTALVEVLYSRAAATLPLLQPSNVDRIALDPDHARLSGKQGWQISRRGSWSAPTGATRFAAKLRISRAAMQHDGQAAIATSFAHAAPHRGVSIELHRKGGSVTTVPLTDAFASSVIWVGETRRDRRIDASRCQGIRNRACRAARRSARPHRRDRRPRAFPRHAPQRRKSRRAAHGSCRRSRPRPSADRRAGPQSRLARRGDACRLRQRGAGAGRRSRQRRGA